MLRGRCFRLKKFYQHDPDLYGRLLITLKNLTSWFIEKNGIQVDLVVWCSVAGTNGFVNFGKLPLFFWFRIVTQNDKRISEGLNAKRRLPLASYVPDNDGP